MPDSLAAETARPEPGRQELLPENAILIFIQHVRYAAGAARSSLRCGTWGRVLTEATWNPVTWALTLGTLVQCKFLSKCCLCDRLGFLPRGSRRGHVDQGHHTPMSPSGEAEAWPQWGPHWVLYRAVPLLPLSACLPCCSVPGVWSRSKHSHSWVRVAFRVQL